jgi:TPR repeat protein
MKRPSIALALALLCTHASAADPEAPPRFYKEPLRMPETDPLFSQGEMLERENRGPEAVKMYARAARAGSGKAAKRLAEIYDKGIPGVARDYPLALRWYNAARVLGEDVPPARR